MTTALVDAATSLCKHASSMGESWSWEWPEKNDLWKDDRVKTLVSRNAAQTCLVAASAVGFEAKPATNESDAVYIKKRWRIATTSPSLPGVLAAFAEDPEGLRPDQFVECRGRVAQRSANYTDKFAQLVWSALAPLPVPRKMCAVWESVGPKLSQCDPPRIPLWCCLVTRTVSPRSAEGQSPGAEAAIKLELEAHDKRGTWDYSSVREVRD